MRRRDFVAATAALAVAGSARAASPPTVLELFTSEACSSCPPAEALLGELAQRPGVIALAWHVDYWNSPAWRDPYATRFATDRQRAYALRLHAEVYTPALVVNGAAMVIGSDPRAVATAMAAAPPAALPVSLRRGASGLNAMVAETSRRLSGLLVAYESMRVRTIGGGENDGRRLTEYNIVRQAAPLDLSSRATGPLQLGSPATGLGIVLLVQSDDLRIRGAAHLPPASVSDRLL
jgi:hypothetical protein